MSRKKKPREDVDDVYRPGPTRIPIDPGEYTISCGDCGSPLALWEVHSGEAGPVVGIRTDRRLGAFYARLRPHTCRGNR